jgi:hypothetical protein
MKQKISAKGVVISFLGIFQILGVIAVGGLTAYSMYTVDSYFWIYLVLIGFTFSCFFSVNLGIERMSYSSYNDKLMNVISVITMVLIMLLILLNLVAILHNANAIDQFFGYNSEIFRKDAFWGHLILEVAYFFSLIYFIESDLFS